MESFEFDATGIEPSLPGGVVPEGFYHLSIKDAELGITKSDDKKADVKFSVDDDRYKRSTIYHTVTFLPAGRKGAGMTVHFLKTIGEPFEGKIKVSIDNWIGKRIFAHVYVDEYMGKKRNKIDGGSIVGPTDGSPFNAIVKSEWEASKQVKQTSDVDDTQVPF